jgi:hypothetical protein
MHAERWELQAVLRQQLQDAAMLHVELVLLHMPIVTSFQRACRTPGCQPATQQQLWPYFPTLYTDAAETTIHGQALASSHNLL